MEKVISITIGNTIIEALYSYDQGFFFKYVSLVKIRTAQACPLEKRFSAMVKGESRPTSRLCSSWGWNWFNWEYWINLLKLAWGCFTCFMVGFKGISLHWFILIFLDVGHIVFWGYLFWPLFWNEAIPLTPFLTNWGARIAVVSGLTTFWHNSLPEAVPISTWQRKKKITLISCPMTTAFDNTVKTAS